MNGKLSHKQVLNSLRALCVLMPLFNSLFGVLFHCGIGLLFVGLTKGAMCGAFKGLPSESQGEHNRKNGEKILNSHSCMKHSS